jgi:hypothetical protein
MKLILDKKAREPKEPEFIVLNEYAQVYSGLKRGYPDFSDEFEDARTITNEAQFKVIQQGTSFILEKLPL